MTDAILVLNAGSPSIKFSLFAEWRGQLALAAGGQVEGIYTALSRPGQGQAPPGVCMTAPERE